MTNLTTVAGGGWRRAGGHLQDHGLYQRSRLPLGRLSGDRQASRRRSGRSRPASSPPVSRGPTSCSSSTSRSCASRPARRIGACVPTIRAPHATVIKASSSTASSAWRWSRATGSSCAARPAWASTRSSMAPATPRRRPSRRCDNVETLLQEAGARLGDVVKATVYVTDRAFLAERQRGRDAPARRSRAGLHVRDREGAREPRAADGSRHLGDQGRAR